ncbi:MAG TPA: hypothetical protein VMI10_21230 [Terriglobales bacterium]|nr:hypothetical protein [Terriglobales bacterium]
MPSPDQTGDQAVPAQLNAELRHAQLEMLSAQCATDRLRLRYSADDLARHGQSEILRKAWSSAHALFEYFDAVVNRMPDRRVPGNLPGMTVEEARLLNASDRLTRYLQEQGRYFRPIGAALSTEQRHSLVQFFPLDLLDNARTIIVEGPHFPRLALDSETRALGVDGLFETAHPFASFETTLVFHEEMTPGQLFHALVHAVQMQALGLEGYAERLVRGFLRTRSHANVPIELHAAMLANAFVGGAQPFSVEEKVRLWINESRY